MRFKSGLRVFLTGGDSRESPYQPKICLFCFFFVIINPINLNPIYLPKTKKTLPFSNCNIRLILDSFNVIMLLFLLKSVIIVEK